jgi:hypothetical protein
MRRASVRSLAVLCSVALLVRGLGCDPKAAAPVSIDTDHDGLSDTDERAIYGTSPTLADTDGDGLTDHEEIVTNAFDPESAPLRFNPRVADVPMLEVEIASIPFVTLTLTDTNGVSQTYEVDRTYEDTVTNTVGVTQTDTEGITNAVSNTFDWTVGVTADTSLDLSAGRDAGRPVVVKPDAGRDAGDQEQQVDEGEDADPSMVSLSNGVNQTTGGSTTFGTTRTSELSIAFSRSQSYAYREAITLAQAYTQSHEIAASGAHLQILAFLRNRGNLAFQITDITLVSSIVVGNGSELPIGNLEVSNTLSNFVPFSLSPGQELGPIAFFKDDMTLEQAIMALQDPRALRMRMGVYELRDENARPYAFDVPTIRARTAAVNIDYGGLHPPEWYLVATNLDPLRPGISVTRALADILRIPFVCDPKRGHVAVRGVTASEDGGTGHWCLFLRHRKDGEDQTTPFCGDVETYDCSTIDLHAGDTLRVVWTAP